MCEFIIEYYTSMKHNILLTPKSASVVAVIPLIFGSIYSATKGALLSYSNTLRLELAPFKIHVLVAMTSGVRSNMAVSQASSCLPPTSVYLPIEKEFEAWKEFSQNEGLNTEAYATGLVEASLRRSPPKELWR
jgi:1-acylglycerone phosphate reductase